MKVNQIKGLNRQARKFLKENCVSKRGVEVMALGFKGYMNGIERINVALIRKDGCWIMFSTDEKILSINGSVDCFSTTKNTIL